MVRGLDKFRQHFADYTEQYILIGGTACDVRFSTRAMNFRVTRDLDIILVVEALSDSFIRHFWDFVKMGQYQLAQVNGEKRFYRFKDPATADFPADLELFSRQPDSLPSVEGIHITDIPTGEDVSSLSAILLNDGYYRFAMANSEVIDGLRVAGDIALIVLKATAFLSNRRRQAEGHQVRTVDIVKHRNDVIRLAAVIERQPATDLTDPIRAELAEFVQVLEEGEDTVKEVLKTIGIKNMQRGQIVEVLKLLFGL